jgi:hypothetical protein
VVTRAAACAAWLATAACGSFQDPNVVVDLRVLAMRAEPADQVIDVDLTRPVVPAELLAQLVPTQVCALIADPALDRRLAWSVTMCPLTLDDRCDSDRPQIALGAGVLDDPDTTLPAPGLCVTVMPDASLLTVLIDVVQGDTLRGLGGIDYAVELRVGGEAADRNLDQYATKTLRVSPRIPANRAQNHNPRIDHVDARLGDAAPVVLPLGRCGENPAPYALAPETKLRLTPVEPDGTREVYVVPTLDGRSASFTESVTYQWIAGAGGYSKGSTGGPHDISGNPAPLFSDYKSPAARDLDGPTDIALWIIQRDERLGLTWYESCLRVAP